VANIYKLSGAAIRIDRIDALDRVTLGSKEIVRLYISGLDGGYKLNFGDDKEMADKVYNDLVKAIEEDLS
jgi:hypothetical protein